MGLLPKSDKAWPLSLIACLYFFYIPTNGIRTVLKDRLVSDLTVHLGERNGQKSTNEEGERGAVKILQKQIAVCWV